MRYRRLLDVSSTLKNWECATQDKFAQNEETLFGKLSNIGLSVQGTCRSSKPTEHGLTLRELCVKRRTKAPRRPCKVPASYIKRAENGQSKSPTRSKHIAQHIVLRQNGHSTAQLLLLLKSTRLAIGMWFAVSGKADAGGLKRRRKS